MWFSWIDSLLESSTCLWADRRGLKSRRLRDGNGRDRELVRSTSLKSGSLVSTRLLDRRDGGTACGAGTGGLGLAVYCLCLECWCCCWGCRMAQVVRHRPQPFGAVPDGELATQDAGAPRDAQRPDCRQAMATSSFWLISVDASALLTVSAIMVHLVAHLSEGLVR